LAINDITVQIMLGGLSTRMGKDKALVTLGGKTLLERAVERWGNYGGGVQLSVGAVERAVMAPEGIPAVADIYPERGPLGGLQAGLQACKTPILLLVAVDCPFLDPSLADRLVDAIGEADACVFTSEGRPQPLFGLYRVSCLKPAEDMLLRGDNRMRCLLDQVSTLYLPEEDPHPFRNLNTPEELAAAELLITNPENIM
jgi:molybdopterin-guanine dinucleotide biosynthesis protein A